MTLKPRSKAKMMLLQKAISAHFDKDSMQFRSAAAVVSELEHKIQDLRGNIKATGKDHSNDVLDAEVVSKHRNWLEDQIKELNMELARALVSLDQARAQLALSSAKCEIIKRIQR